MFPLLCAALLAFDVAALPLLPAPVPPPSNDAAWRQLKIVDGVLLREAPSGMPRAPWGSGEGEVAAPLDTVIAHVTDFAALKTLMPRAEKVEVLQRDDHQAVVYFRFDLPWPISDRDWTVRYQFARSADGRFVMQWSDVNQLGPPVHRAVRVSPVRGRWELSPTPRGTTWVRYIFLAELGGRIPQSAIEQTAWKEPLETLRGMRKALSRR